MPHVTLDLPPAFLPLWEPHRYKVMYGGRGAAKSWQYARVLLVMGAERKLRILCAREIQNSIQESVHQLLSEQIDALGLSGFYTIEKTKITGANGTDFFFSGLKHKINSIKSIEGVDIVWVEEAHTVSKHSWQLLIPTIRKQGSEIWVSFNPELDSDETFRRFVLSPPENAWVKHVTFRDNPWFSDTLREEMRVDRLRDEDTYNHVWLGHTKQMLDGAVYAQELRRCEAEGRITRVPYTESHPVRTAWDLGFHDSTAIWWFQSVGMDLRLIDYYENRQQPLSHYVKVLQDKEYVYDTHFLPHDAASNDLRGLSIERQLKDLVKGRGQVKVLPRDSVDAGINAVRTSFPMMWFDAERCEDGLQMLRRYRYEVDEDTGQFSRRPLHDLTSHCADSLRYVCMSSKPSRGKVIELQLDKPERRKIELNLHGGNRQRQHAWLGR